MSLAKKEASKPKGGGAIELYSPTYFAACGLGGVVSCGPTHTGELRFRSLRQLPI